jgi:hypothetical protein
LRICSAEDKPVLPLLQKENVARSEDARKAAGPQPAPEFPNQFCPVCSARFESRHCKMLCPRCGFFLACSEFE